MFIENVKIKSFRVLKDIEIRFQVPNPETRENVVNIVAGVNGTGKSSLLLQLMEIIGSPFDIGESGGRFKFYGIDNTASHRADANEVYKFFEKQRHKAKDRTSDSIGSRCVFISSLQNMSYQQVHTLKNDYAPVTRVNTSTILGNAEFYIKEFILANERISRESDPKLRAQAAVNKFNAHFKDADLLTRLHDLDPKQFNRPVFKNIQGDLVTIDQLSDGEKQLYGRVIALMILDPKDSIILIDEPEIALHPSWQQKIMQIYASIGENNQFIVATHSPQIIANTPYQNLILLTKQDGKVVPVYPSQPPSGVDINSILSEVMGADVMPKDQELLYEEYRQLVDQGQEESEQGVRVKAEILKRVSEHSEFLQEMQFMIELREA